MTANEKWKIEEGNIYKVNKGPVGDIGLIVFDHGKAIGSKVNEMKSLKKDYDFFVKGGLVYVYLSKGNPTDIYSDIEFCVTQHIVKLKSNSTIRRSRCRNGKR